MILKARHTFQVEYKGYEDTMTFVLLWPDPWMSSQLLDHVTDIVKRLGTTFDGVKGIKYLDRVLTLED